MSPSDLAESGVIGLEDVLQSELAALDSETLKTSESDPDTPGLANESPSTSERPVQLDTRCSEVDNMGILQELRDLQVLEEQIKEEQLKLEALRCTETERLQSEEQTLGHVTTRSSCRERRMFLAQLEKEKLEVEMMERSLSREMEKAGKVRKRSSKGHRVVKCSVMERNSKLKDLDGELLRNCRPSPESVHHDPQQTDVEKPDSSVLNTEECSSAAPPNPAEEASLTDSSVTLEPLSSTSQSVPTTSLSEIEIGGPAAPNSIPCSESLQDTQSDHGEPFVLSSLSGTPDQKLEAMDSSEGPNVHPEHPKTETSSCDCDSAADQVELETSEAPSSQKSSIVRDAFDPGGVVIAPVPAPRRALPLENQQTRPSASEQVESELSAAESELSAAISKLEACTQSTSQGQHMQNNNNNTAVVCSEETREISGSSTTSPEVLPYHDDNSTTGPCAGRDGVSDDCGGSMRTVCRSPISQLQLNASTRQVQNRVLTKEALCIG